MFRRRRPRLRPLLRRARRRIEQADPAEAAGAEPDPEGEETAGALGEATGDAAEAGAGEPADDAADSRGQPDESEAPART